MKKENLLVTNEYYHVFNKSIAGYKIFNTEQEFERMLCLVRYYQMEEVPVGFSNFIRAEHVECKGLMNSIHYLFKESKKLVEINAFCIMPTHFHLVVKQLIDNGISKFMNNIQNGYTRYFNIKIRRKGPLWVGRFKRILVETDEQLWHLSRYIHLNPVTANLVKRPQNWLYSSYREYMNEIKADEKISFPNGVFDIDPCDYKEFVDDRIDYQRELGLIKHLLFD